MKKITIIILFVFSSYAQSQQSVAREWNEMILSAIRSDFARPTVHARNLFHSSVLMYDAWALFDSQANTVFLGKNFGGYTCDFNGISTPTDVDSARHEIISYAIFRLLNHRFQNSPGGTDTLDEFETLFTSFGYDPNFTSLDYSSNSYAALGNYMANEMIQFGFQDNSNEQSNYSNQFYSPSNPPLILENYYETNDIDPDRWQPLAFDVYVDQSGNEYPLNTPSFLSPEWGSVIPFSLSSEDLQILNNGFESYVYNDPGPPVYIQNSNEDGISDPFKWHFALVASWSSHLDPNDETMIDISPGAIGNFDLSDLPETFEEYQSFYDFTNGGDASTGHSLNPKTGQPYTPQLVKRSDYARVLAEFWADGPDSETPPGHWFTILNYVSDQPSVVKKIGGIGNIVSNLEWDVKSYLVLGGAMHDVAINTWGIKGYYDYLRPISAIRYMAGKGQSSDASSPSYDPHGLPLIEGLIELIDVNDPLSGENDEHIGRIKIKSWRGPDFINDSTTDTAGVDWIMGTHWWPYQRGTFVTPPFGGYLSGHSTFSRAAAEVLTQFTGDPFFPGGMGTFEITNNDFLFFEVGPTSDMTLQWATYRDASDQTSLSRIWGGIHPPIDDIKGRIIGDKIGGDAFNLALEYFNGTLHTEDIQVTTSIEVYPNPFTDVLNINTENDYNIEIYTIDGKLVNKSQIESNRNIIHTNNLKPSIYFIKFTDKNNKSTTTKKIVKY
ncbi:T9SS type A sorting domain-containing protein [Psychroserpens sp. Hel_I_66]|uniref:T9SS type A sorting domain-containing protein n=1 Tax=Psychroserpens sp. Hel_I_66 TaxID=1250004 RepID=UPI00064870D5|nr:T9SS type A sorting domain-containing protein [Psychroserpens sp. Hel_I_66]